MKHKDLVTLLLVPAIMAPMTFTGRGPVWTSPILLFGLVLPPVLLGALFCARGLSRSWRTCLFGSLLLLGGFAPLVISLMMFPWALLQGAPLTYPLLRLLDLAGNALYAIFQLRPEVALALPVLAIFALLIWLGHWISERTMSAHPRAWVAALLVLLAATPLVTLLLEPVWLFALPGYYAGALHARMLYLLKPAFVILAGLLIGGTVVAIAKR